MASAVQSPSVSPETSFFQKPDVKKIFKFALYAIAFAATAAAVYCGFARHYTKAAASAALQP